MTAGRLDARVLLATAVGGWIVALAARQPAGPLAVAALALCVLAALRRLRALRALAPALFAGAVAAGLQALLSPALHRQHDAALLLARVFACGAVGSALAASAPFAELLAALSWLRVPAPLLELLVLAQRQRHSLAETAWTIRDAQRLRLGWVGWRRSIGSAGALIGATACRAVDQAEVTADALALRGAAGPIPPAPPSPARPRDAAFALAAAAALAACAVILGGVSP